ncbi:hypothetical protein J6590_080477 [Homalodisca vitripennis]|nr:hypothetical protein J6590_080477 [Homalodisca vitripennis]
MLVTVSQYFECLASSRFLLLHDCICCSLLTQTVKQRFSHSAAVFTVLNFTGTFPYNTDLLVTVSQYSECLASSRFLLLHDCICCSLLTQRVKQRFSHSAVVFTVLNVRGTFPYNTDMLVTVSQYFECLASSRFLLLHDCICCSLLTQTVKQRFSHSAAVFTVLNVRGTFPYNTDMLVTVSQYSECLASSRFPATTRLYLLFLANSDSTFPYNTDLLVTVSQYSECLASSRFLLLHDCICCSLLTQRVKQRFSHSAVVFTVLNVRGTFPYNTDMLVTVSQYSECLASSRFPATTRLYLLFLANSDSETTV